MNGIGYEKKRVQGITLTFTYPDNLASLTPSWYRPLHRILTSGNKKNSPKFPWRSSSWSIVETRLPYKIGDAAWCPTFDPVSNGVDPSSENNDKWATRNGSSASLQMVDITKNRSNQERKFISITWQSTTNDVRHEGIATRISHSQSRNNWRGYRQSRKTRMAKFCCSLWMLDNLKVVWPRQYLVIQPSHILPHIIRTSSEDLRGAMRPEFWA